MVGSNIGAEFVSFDQLLQQSDVVIITCSLNDETRYLFSSAAFAAMKSNSVLINISRGGNGIFILHYKSHNQEFTCPYLDQKKVEYGSRYGARIELSATFRLFIYLFLILVSVKNSMPSSKEKKWKLPTWNEIYGFVNLMVDYVLLKSWKYARIFDCSL